MNVFVGYPRELIGNSFHYGDKDRSVCRCFLLISKKLFLAKYLSGRTMELDKVHEPERDDQSSTTSEMVPGSSYEDHGSHVYKVL